MIEIKSYRPGTWTVTIRKHGSKFHGICKTFTDRRAMEIYSNAMRRALNI